VLELPRQRAGAIPAKPRRTLAGERHSAAAYRRIAHSHSPRQSTSTTSRGLSPSDATKSKADSRLKQQTFLQGSSLAASHRVGLWYNNKGHH